MRLLSKTLPLSMGIILCLFFYTTINCQSLRLVAVDDSVSTHQDKYRNFRPIDNDYDLNGKTLYPHDNCSINILQNPLHGYLNVSYSYYNAKPNFTYAPNKNFIGLDSIIYQICDNYSNCDTAIIRINVYNNPPILPDTSYSIYYSNATFYMSKFVDDIEDDINWDSFKIVATSNKGTANLDSTYRSTLYYRPQKGFSAYNDTIFYSVCDYGNPSLCDTALFIVKVKENRKPHVLDSTYILPSTDVILDLTELAYDDDLDNNLEFQMLTSPRKGIANFVSEFGENYINYSPPLNNLVAFRDTIYFKVCDIGGLCDTGLVILDVQANQAPVAEAMYITTPFFQNAYGDVKSNVFDFEKSLDFENIKIIINPKFGNITYFNEGYFNYFCEKGNIVDSFTYRICDIQGLCTEGVVIINVGGNTAAPFIKKNEYNRLGYQVRAIKGKPIGGSIPVHDADENFKDPIIVTKPLKNGNLEWKLKFNPATHIRYNNDDRNYISFAYEYVSDSNFVGSDTINFKICDTEGLCDSTTIFFEVNDNKPSVIAVDDILKLNFNQTYIQGQAQNNDINILYNNSNIYYDIISNPKHGIIQMNNDGNFSYSITNNFTGRDTAFYQVCNIVNICDTAQLIFIIENQEASHSSFKKIIIETPKNTPLISNEILKPEGNIISKVFLGFPKSGTAVLDTNANLKYTPLSNFIGKDTLAVQVCTDLGECDTTLFYISVINSSTLSPLASDDYITLASNTTISSSALSNDTDNGSPIMHVLIVSNPQNGIININNNGIFTYTPAKDFVGTDRADYGICNINGCDTASIYFTVLAVNPQNAPIAADDNFTTLKNTIVAGSVATNDKDADNNIQINGFRLLKNPNKGTLSLNNNGNFTYLPQNNFIGSDSASYIICDSTNLCDTAFIFFTVKDVPVKHAPVAKDDYFSTNENEPLSNTVAANDFDVDNDLKINSFKVLKTTNKGVLIFKEEGSFLYTPNANFIGADTASYTVCDTTGLCDTAWVFFSVKKVYHKPTLVGEDFITTFNTALKGNVALNDSDIDNDLNTQSYFISQNPKNGSVKMWNDGKFLYLPKYFYSGIDSFYYEVCDSQNLCSKAKCIVTIQAGYLSGKIFIDDNGDGIFNAGEKGVPNMLVKINDKNEVFTNNFGDYQTIVDTSKSYQITPVLNTRLYTLSPLSKAVFTGNNYNQRIDNQDFALKAINPVSDLLVSVEQGNARPGFESITKVTYTNKGTSNLNGNLAVKLDEYLSLMSTDIDPTNINGNNMSWNFTNLRPFESRSITLMIKTSVNAPRSYYTKIDYNGILSSVTDVDTSNNKGVSEMEVRGSFDPNDIAVDIEKVIQKGTIRESVIPLTYTIRFQNTGNAEAYRVEVIDTLSEKLDITSLEMIAASHAFEMKVISDSTISNPVVKWIFNNINLVDSTTKEACSHGFIKYKINNIKDKTNYSKDSILNKAAIYFDFNEPVITNTAMTKFSFSTPTKEIKNLSFQVYPNPTNDWVTISLDKNIEAQVIVTNLLGQVLKRDILRGSSGQVNLSSLIDGVYFITLKTDKGQGSIKILKQ